MMTLKGSVVIALADRMRLRDACQKNVTININNNSIVSLKQAQQGSFRDTPLASSIPSRQATSARGSVINERSVLFEPYLGRRDRSKKLRVVDKRFLEGELQNFGPFSLCV